MREEKTTGQLAEDVVANKYVKSRGWKVLARNYRKTKGEIDIVARDKKNIIFIEVKALNSEHAKNFSPEDHFTSEKQRRVINTSAMYLKDNKYPENVEYRIDLAAVEIDYKNKNARLRYYKNVIA